MKLNKNETFVLIIGGSIFLLLSYLLQSYVSQTHPFCDIDSSAYLRNGFLWYKYGSFSPLNAPQPLPIYALGYPLFIGLCYKILGPSSVFIIWVQILLAIIVGIFLFFITRRLFESNIAIITYGLWSINFGFLIFSHFILAEMILIFFLAVFFTLFSAFLISGKPLALGFSGLVLGVSVLMKVAAFYFPFMLMILLFFTSKQNWQLWFKRIIIFIIPFALPLLAFMIHNKIVFNQFKLTYIDSFNLCAFFYSQVLAYDHGTNWGIEIEQLAKQYKTEGQHFDGIKQQFWRDFFSRPHTFIFMWLRNVFKICAGLYSTNLKILTNNNIHGRELSYFNMHGNIWQKATAYIAACTPYRWVKIVAWLEVVWSIIRYILCCLGLLFLWHIKRYWLSLFFLAYIFYFSFMIACDGTARYRFFFEFVLIILAALGIQVVINWLVSKQTTSFKRTV